MLTDDIIYIGEDITDMERKSMSNTEYALTGKGCRNTELLFEYVTGTCGIEAEKIETEMLRDGMFCAALTVPVREPELTAQLYKGFKAEGINMPLLFCRYMGDCVLSIFESTSITNGGLAVRTIAEEISIAHFTVYEEFLDGKGLYGVYDRLAKQLDRAFYFGKGINVVEAVQEYKADYCIKFSGDLVVKSNPKRTIENVEKLFALVNDAQMPVKYVKKYLTNMYAEMLMRNAEYCNAEMICAAAEIGNAVSIFEVKGIFMETAQWLAMPETSKKSEGYSNLVRETVHIISKNIGNEDLSLRWIAGNILYTNVDYLGKIFKKETGKNFSHYVMEKRMELAKELILEGESYKIYEVAESVGFGSNSQYFSQVFKKYAGISPIEYREYAKELRRTAAAGNNTR